MGLGRNLEDGESHSCQRNIQGVKLALQYRQIGEAEETGALVQLETVRDRTGSYGNGSGKHLGDTKSMMILESYRNW